MIKSFAPTDFAVIAEQVESVRMAWQYQLIRAKRLDNQWLCVGGERTNIGDMSVFESHKSYWAFRAEVERRSRYIRSARSAHFLEVLVATSISRTKEIPDGSVLWRAQVGNDWQQIEHDGDMINAYERPFLPERMIPQRDRAMEGRANPKGIPYLYTATDRVTAMAEVRPWCGSFVSVAQFLTQRPLRVVNLAADGHSRVIYMEEPGAEDREKAVWVDLNRAFSKPIDQNEVTADYASTQIIAELFRNQGFDGIVYKSSLGLGHNIALFEMDCVGFVSCHLFRTESISFDFSLHMEKSIMLSGPEVTL